MAGGKEAIALVLDVSPSMEDAPEGQETSLEKSLNAVNMIIQRKIFSKSKDEVALILFGTQETNNPLADSLSGYENISVLHKLSSPTVETLRIINENANPGTESGDFVDAVVVALDHLINEISGRKMDPRIVLFTNLASPFGSDKLDTVVKSMKDLKVQFTFVGPEISEDGDDNDDDEFYSRKSKKDGESGAANNSNEKSKPLSSQQLEGVKCVKAILEEVDGEGMSLAEALPTLSFFQTRAVKQTTVFRGPLEIGDSLKINLYGYVKVKEAKATTFGKLSALSEASRMPGDMKVSLQRSSHLQDDDFTEVDDAHISKVYKYGKTLVPYSKIDQQSLKPQTERCLKVLGFTDRSNVNQSSFQGESVYLFVPQPGDKDAAVALSALVHALEEKDMVAIVRYCRCKNAAPKLAVLLPMIKVQYEGLYMFILPFAEDIRKFPFAPLSNITITDEQMSAMDAIIDGMDLSTVHRDADGEESEAFKPKKILNPTIQRLCQCIQKRALNPTDETLPDPDKNVARSIEALPEQVASCQPHFEKIKELFPLNEVEKKVSKNAANVFSKSSEESVEPKSKRTKLSNDNEDADFSFSALARGNAIEIGTGDPVQDYDKIVCDSDATTFKEASEKMGDRILQLVNDSFLDQYYKKALECLKKLRGSCVQRTEADIFNNFLEKIKQTMLGQRRNDFWELLKTDKIGLITNNECHTSRVTEEEAIEFFGSEKEEAQETEAPAIEEDVDDLLDMM